MRNKKSLWECSHKDFLLVWGEEDLSPMIGKVVVFPVEIISYFLNKRQVLFKWQFLPVFINTGSVGCYHGNLFF